MMLSALSGSAPPVGARRRDFTIERLPIGITFIGGGPWLEPALIGYAYDFEQATQVRVPPQFIPVTSRVLDAR